MINEIVQRQEKARDFMRRNGYCGLVMATLQNIQYFTDVTEPSMQTCGVVIITQEPEAVFAVSDAQGGGGFQDGKKSHSGQQDDK